MRSFLPATAVEATPRLCNADAATRDETTLSDARDTSDATGEDVEAIMMLNEEIRCMVAVIESEREKRMRE